MKFTDDTIMQEGLHAGEKLANIPADYLLYLYEKKKCNNELMQYIEENLEVLKQEMKSIPKLSFTDKYENNENY